jgi:hypothetical protein
MLEAGPLRKPLRTMVKKLTGLSDEQPTIPGSVFGRLAWRRA